MGAIENCKSLLDEIEQLRRERDEARHSLELANNTLKRYGIATRFGKGADIPDGAITFVDNGECDLAVSRVLTADENVDIDSLRAEFVAMMGSGGPIVKLESTYTDETGTVWEVPTAYSYAAVCKANEAKRVRMAELEAKVERLNQIAVHSKAFIDAIDDGMGCGDNLMCIEEYPCDECPVVQLRKLLSEGV